MRELLGQSLSPEADEAALEELAALEAQEADQEAAELPEVPQVSPAQMRTGFRPVSSDGRHTACAVRVCKASPCSS